MASHQRVILTAAALLVVITVKMQFAEGQSLDSKLDCRKLPATSCAFAVDSYGARCFLESNTALNDLTAVYSCKTSKIHTANFEEYIETEDCVSHCGMDRLTLGIFAYSLQNLDLPAKLCSMECQSGCSNIVDLYTNMVAATTEGASLARFCNDLQASQGLRSGMRSRQLKTLLNSAPVRAL